MTRDELLKISHPLICTDQEVKALLNNQLIQKPNFIRHKKDISDDLLQPKYKKENIYYIKEGFYSTERCIKYYDNINIYYYRADASSEIKEYLKNNKQIWKTPVQMPLKAARIFVKVVDSYKQKIKRPSGTWKWISIFERVVVDD
jgi:hypothetical protein